jgi:hypothetical protein
MATYLAIGCKLKENMITTLKIRPFFVENAMYFGIWRQEKLPKALSMEPYKYNR